MEETVAPRLRFYFARLGMTRGEFAKRMEVTVSAVSYWLSGGSVPTLGNLEKAIAIFGIDMVTFWGPLPEDVPAAAEDGKEAKAEAAG